MMLARVGRLLARPASGTWLACARSFSRLASNRGLLARERFPIPCATQNFDSSKRFFRTSGSSFEGERKLLDILTPEFCQTLAQDKTSKKFKLKSLRQELERLYDQEFPLPDSLTEDQWNALMELNDPDLRILYLVIQLDILFYLVKIEIRA